MRIHCSGCSLQLGRAVQVPVASPGPAALSVHGQPAGAAAQEPAVCARTAAMVAPAADPAGAGAGAETGAGKAAEEAGEDAASCVGTRSAAVQHFPAGGVQSLTAAPAGHAAVAAGEEVDVPDCASGAQQLAGMAAEPVQGSAAAAESQAAARGLVALDAQTDIDAPDCAAWAGNLEPPKLKQAAAAAAAAAVHDGLGTSAREPSGAQVLAPAAAPPVGHASAAALLAAGATAPLTVGPLCRGLHKCISSAGLYMGRVSSLHE